MQHWYYRRASPTSRCGRTGIKPIHCFVLASYAIPYECYLMNVVIFKWVLANSDEYHLLKWVLATPLSQSSVCKIHTWQS